MAVIPLAIGILIFSTFAWKTEALQKASVAREFVITAPNSTTVPLNGTLYTILKNHTHVYINSTDVNFKPCTIAIDPFEDIIRGKMEVQVAFDREIFIWGIQGRNMDGDITKTYYSFLWIDPWQCSYKSIPVPEFDSAQKTFLPRFIRYRPTPDDELRDFDIFFPSLKLCRPCRFSSKKIIKSRESYNFLPINGIQRPFYIFWMEPDYIFVRNLDNDKTYLHYLDDSFGIINSIIVDYPVETVTIRKSNQRNVGVCTKKRNNQTASDARIYEEVRCEGLNSKFLTVVSISIPISNKDVSSVSLEFDARGNSYISFAEDKELRVYIFDMDGKMLQSYNLGEVDKRFQQYSDNQNMPSSDQYLHWDVHGFLVSNEYCVIVEQMTQNYASPLHVVKCIDV